MSKKKAHHQSSWEDARRDESISEEDILNDLRHAIRDAISGKEATAAKELASAYSEIAGIRERKVGF